MATGAARSERMSTKPPQDPERSVVPPDLRRRMQTEHGGSYGFRFVTIANFFSYEPHGRMYAEFGLVGDDYTVLANLYEWGDMTANVIRTLTGRPKNSISRSVIKLVQEEMIDSKTDTKDRRRSILTITPKGRETYRKVMPIFQEQEQRMFSFLNAREQRNLDTLLLKILGNWSHEFIDES
jgi:DNA-binding MarR family transcriptional regulator